MDTDFAVGDVVKLKSGGHDMVVQGLEKANGDVIDKASGPDARVRTIWHDDSGKLHTSHGLPVALLESVKKVERSKDDGDDAAGGESGVQHTINRQDKQGQRDYDKWREDRQVPGQGNEGNNSHSGLNRPIAPMEQSANKRAVHEGDDLPQSLGNEAERQPGQEPEIAHARMTDDPYDGRGTVHEPGRHYDSSAKLKDNR